MTKINPQDAVMNPGKEVFDMEVNLNNIPIQNYHINIGAHSGHEQGEVAVQKSKPQVKLEDVMMDINDVKDFLYMLLGARNIHRGAQGSKGSNVNVSV
jgi:hypothetical protein